MGKTCHLPGTRNHLIGDAERLERKPRTTPKVNPGIIVARNPVANEYWLDYVYEFDEKISEGVKKGRIDKRFKVFSPESVVWELVRPEKWDEIYERHVDNNRFSNGTARSRSRNIAKIREAMREFQQDLILDSYWHVDPDSGLCAPPDEIGEYALERDRYVKIDSQTLGVNIDRHEAGNAELLDKDAATITAMLHYAGVKVSLSADDLNTTIPIAGGATLPTRRNQHLATPATPVRAIEFDYLKIY